MDYWKWYCTSCTLCKVHTATNDTTQTPSSSSSLSFSSSFDFFSFVFNWALLWWWWCGESERNNSLLKTTIQYKKNSHSHKHTLIHRHSHAFTGCDMEKTKQAAIEDEEHSTHKLCSCLSRNIVVVAVAIAVLFLLTVFSELITNHPTIHKRQFYILPLLTVNRWASFYSCSIERILCLLSLRGNNWFGLFVDVPRTQFVKCVQWINKERNCNGCVCVCVHGNWRRRSSLIDETNVMPEYKIRVTEHIKYMRVNS